ncbi:uncharacterized protein EV154DRAFT_479012 [Mucor mucedo]|uniref:uncharacterized protein n=1 Tax=Mucor mucedo TaxID=29922 RepID=UPI00222013B3|nr:uncharacterized protein EV154DRAFT_479012 [Mucor mucedo]KAI7893714.1 hypothetical protein EV154DRAFT_479012 [Mucor mucedo]
MPKIRKGELEVLNQLFVFGTQYCVSAPLCKAEYNKYREQQINSVSLCSLGLFDDLILLLRKVSYDDFLDQVWDWKGGPEINDHGKNFLIVCKYILSTFHLVQRTPPMHVMNHERSFFCESILPGLLALSKITKFIEFKWYEAKYKATKGLYLKDGNYDGRFTLPEKYIDALGILKGTIIWRLRFLNHQGIKLSVTIIDNTGMVEEHTRYIIEDSMKILESNLASLREETCHFENVSLETFKEFSAYGVTLTKIHDKQRWKNIEMRSSQIPRTWDDRLLLLEYLELLGTLYIELSYSQEVESVVSQIPFDIYDITKLIEERVNVGRPSGPLVRSIME